MAWAFFPNVTEAFIRIEKYVLRPCKAYFCIEKYVLRPCKAFIHIEK